MSDLNSRLWLGAWLQPGTMPARIVPGNNATDMSAGNAEYTTGWDVLQYHPEAGLRQNNLDFAAWSGGDIAVMGEGNQQIASRLDADLWKGGIYVIHGCSVATNAWLDGTDGNNHSQASADAIAASIVAALDPTHSHAHVLAYSIADDVTMASRGPFAIQLAHTVQLLDLTRPCSFGCTDPLVWDLWVATHGAADLKLAITYRYPAGNNSSGVPLLEGDFHRSTFGAVPNLGGGGGDWIDAQRQWISHLPGGCHKHLVLQGHGNSSVSPTGLRPITPNELKLQVAQAIAEGWNSLSFFQWDDTNSPTWLGLARPERDDARTAIAEIGSRFSPRLRTMLGRTEKVADAFTVTGGGSNSYPSNYPHAHIGTLSDGTNDYVIVSNHDDAPATVTIDSATKTGHLINLETKTRHGIGSSIILPKFDWASFKLDPIIGVPEWHPDQGIDVETWWDTKHWANPDCELYLDSAAVQRHPYTVDVTPATIQAAINTIDRPATLLMAPGSYSHFELVGKSNLHFEPADPDNRPIARSLFVLPSEYARMYFGPTTGSGLGSEFRSYAGMVPIQTEPWLSTFTSPVRDIIFRGIDFVGGGVPDPVRTLWIQSSIDGLFYGFGSRIPINLRGVHDCLIDDCSITKYYAAHTLGDPTAHVNTSDPGYVTDQAPTGHPGFIQGNANCRNVVIRNTPMDGGNFTFGFPVAVYFDGGMGCVVTDCPITGKYHSQQILWLCNDDFSGDLHKRGRIDRDQDLFQANFNVFARSTVSGTPTVVSVTGANCLVTDIAGSTVNDIMLVNGRVGSNITSKGVFYEHLGNVLRDSTFGTVIDNGVEVNTAGCYSAAIPSTHRYRSRIGKTTVKNVHASSIGGEWLHIIDTAGIYEGGDTVTGNTP